MTRAARRALCRMGAAFRRSIIAVALLLGLGTALAGCGVTTESSPRRISEQRLPAALRPQDQTQTSLGPSPEPVAVWLVGDDGLVRVTHRVEPPVTATAVLASLGTGPTDAETARSLRSAIPDAAMVVKVTVVAGTADVELHSSFNQIPAKDQVLAIGQIVLTLTNLRGVGQVRFELGGAEVAVPLPDGRTADAPVSADDYSSLRQP